MKASRTREYNVFFRAWYRMENGSKVPGAGKRTYLAYGVTEDEARAMCKEWNDSHNPGELSVKAEFESV